MKKLYAAIAMMFAVSSFAQQLTNGGFETWTGTPARPAPWSTIESATSGVVSGVTFKDSTIGNFIEGTASIRLKTDSVNTLAGRVLLDGLAVYGNIGVSLQGLSFSGLPFTFRPDTLKFFFRYRAVGNDSADLAIFLTKWNATTQQTEDVTAGGVRFGNSGTAWVNASIAITYLTQSTPDSLLLIFASSGSNPQQGSELNVDNVRFAYKTSVGVQEVALEYADVVMYPNPTTDFIAFNSTKDLSAMSVRVYSLNGELVSEQPLSNNRADVSSMSAGTYVFELVEKKFSVVKGKFNIVK